MALKDDSKFLISAAQLALRGSGSVAPNPRVGAVVVRDGRIIGRGWHRAYGAPHAEVEALNDCLTKGSSPRGASLYVTLEPCNHQGKTPPCTESIIRAGVSRVVFGAREPNQIAQGGEQRLREAGLLVQCCDNIPAVLDSLEPFRKWVTLRRPWVVAKWAQSIDGRIATKSGQSKWLSNRVSRLAVHRLRAKVDAILIGIGTVLSDDPLLTVRGVPHHKRLQRVVLDTNLQLPLDSQLVRTSHVAPVIVFCSLEALTSNEARERELLNAGVSVCGVPSEHGGVAIGEVLRILGETQNVYSVLVEGGAAVLTSFLRDDLIDELRVFQAPLLLGDALAVGALRSDAALDIASQQRYLCVSARRIKDDVELRYRRRTLLN